MKGPGYKLTHDVRRTWRCPACGAERKVAGDITSLICSCRPEGTFMTLVAERTVAPRPQYDTQGHDIRSSEFGIEDMPVLQPHPSSLPPERTGPRRPRPGSDAALQSPESKTSEPTAAAVPAAPPPVQTPPVQPAPAPAPAPPPEPPAVPRESEDDWGEGIL
jgi:hypothetical protein